MKFYKKYIYILKIIAIIIFIFAFKLSFVCIAIASETETITMSEFEALCLEHGMASFDKPLVNIKLHSTAANRQVVQTLNSQLNTQKYQDISLINTNTNKIDSIDKTTIKATPTQKVTPELKQKPILQQTQVNTNSSKTNVDEKLTKNMRIIVSGDKVMLQDSIQQNSSKNTQQNTVMQIKSMLSKPVKSDIIIPNPPVIKPTVVKTNKINRAKISDKMIWPVNGKVSSGFGRRSKRRSHDGVDIPMPEGTPIMAAQNGIVHDTSTTNSGAYRGYGNTVVIDHGNGLVSLYAHCSKLNVKKGQKIQQGDIVAFVGDTGRTTTHHVHFELRKNGSPVNPIPYLAAR